MYNLTQIFIRASKFKYLINYLINEEKNLIGVNDNDPSLPPKILLKKATPPPPESQMACEKRNAFM